METRSRNKAIICSAKPLSDKQKAKAASKALKEASKLALLNCGFADQSNKLKITMVTEDMGHAMDRIICQALKTFQLQIR